MNLIVFRQTTGSEGHGQRTGSEGHGQRTISLRSNFVSNRILPNASREDHEYEELTNDADEDVRSDEMRFTTDKQNASINRQSPENGFIIPR